MKFEWKTRPLAEELRNGNLPEGEKFKYLLVWIILLWVGGFPLQQNELTQVDMVAWLFSIPVTILGIAVCFRTNAAGDNRHFIERLVCLSFPIFIELLLLSVVVMACTEMLFDENTSLANLIYFVIGSVIEVGFFLRLNHILKFVAKVQPMPNGLTA